MDFLGERYADTIAKERMTFASHWLVSHLQGKCRSFSKAFKKELVGFDDKMNQFVHVPGKVWGVDVDTVYAPMIWDNSHWVGLAINIEMWAVEVLDPNPYNNDALVAGYMKPVLEMLPYVLRKLCPVRISEGRGLQPFTWTRITGVYVNERTGDCGPVAAKFMELHANGDPSPGMEGMTDALVDNFRKQYAMDIYREWVLPLYF